MSAGPAKHRKTASSFIDERRLLPDERFILTLYLKHGRGLRRRRGSAEDLAELMKRVSREQLEVERRQEFKGPIAQVSRFAKRNGMAIIDADALRCRVKLSVAVADAERVFATELRQMQHGERLYHFPILPPRLPPALAEIVQAVLGLDARPSIRKLRNMAGPGGNTGLFPSAMARLYGMETGGRGAGQCIAIVEPSGGYDPNDLAAACRAMNLPVPQIVDINVGSGHNAFGANLDADKEVSLDIQVVAGVSPEARIAVYFTENSESGLADGITEALHDRNNRPSVIVITWGEPEILWPDAARNAMDTALADGIRLGITVVAAAGDDLATERMGDGRAHVDYPASSPYVLGCGGTLITLDGAGSVIADEVVWNDGSRGTGGGISDIYPVPAYQKSVTLPPSINDGRRRRGVPDVAAAAAETSGYHIVLGGSDIVTGGTSAVAPLWGAFIALINERRGRSVGFVNPLLYQNPTLLRPVISGNNKPIGTNIGYNAGPEWSGCTGLGTPRGADIARAFAVIA